MLSFIPRRRPRNHTSSKPSASRRRMSVEWLEPRLLLSQGHGGGGGGGGQEPPADPAIAYTDQRWVRTSVAWDLAVMNADGSNPTVLLNAENSGGLGYLYPAWSPDVDTSTPGYQGTLAVKNVKTKNEILLVDVSVVDGTPQADHVRVLVDTDDPAVSSSVLGNPAWSPDLDAVTPGYQGWIAFSASYSINVIRVQWDPVAGMVQPVGPSEVRYAVDTQDEVNDTVAAPTWSPDGDRLVFQHWIYGDNSLLMMHSDGSNLTAVVPQGVFSEIGAPEWSRSDNRVAFNGDGELYTVDVLGGADSLEPLSVSGKSPSWSPNDQFLVYSALGGSGNGENLLTLELATGQESVLASSKKTQLLWPDWRSDPDPMPNQTGTAAAVPADNSAGSPQTDTVLIVLSQQIQAFALDIDNGDAIANAGTTVPNERPPSDSSGLNAIPHPLQSPTFDDRTDLVDHAFSDPATFDDPLLGDLAVALAG